MALLRRRAWFRWSAALTLAGALFPLAHAAAAFDPVAETWKLINTLPPEARARSDAYFQGGYWLPLWDLLITLGFCWGMLHFRVVHRLRDWALQPKVARRVLGALVFVAAWLGAAAALKAIVPRTPDWLWMVRFDGSLLLAGIVAFVLLRRRIGAWSVRPRLHVYLGGAVFLALFTTASYVLTMPWGLYVGYFRVRAYGLSNLSLADWCAESLKGQVIFTVGFSLVGALLYLGIRRWPKTWWVGASVATPFLLFLAIVITPVFIAPVFNNYEPLQDPKIRDPILSLARANGVPVDNVYQFDASKQTKRISANVSGAFGTIRVSLNDNLLHRCTPATIQAVMGHELGHYVLNHMSKLVVYQSLVFAAAFAFTAWFFGAAVRRGGARWNVRGSDDFAGLPVLVAGLSIFLLLASPVLNTISRTVESEADIFGLNAARQPDGFAAAALQLSEYRKLAPGKWEEIIFFDHPSGYQRILMAMRWKAEHLPEFPAGTSSLPPAATAP